MSSLGPSPDDRLRDPDTGEWNVAEVKHRSKGWIAVLVALAIVLGGAWFVGGKALDVLTQIANPGADYDGTGKKDVQVVIPSGSSMTKVAQILQDKDVVKSAEAFRRVATVRADEAGKVQAGTYTLKTQMSSESAFEALLDPANLVRNLLKLPEGQRLTQQLQVMADATKLPVSEFEAAAKDKAIGLPAWANGKAEGFLYPETYELPAQPTGVSTMKLAVDQFNKVTGSLDFANRAAASPAKDPYTALIMASLVEREAPRQEDRVKVARVFYNRLAAKQPLQSDATVAYAANITGRVWTTDKERQVNSPYNTYLSKNAGKLPPGPITSPTKEAMEAALAPAEGDWMFFVPVNLNTGETEFNRTFEEHQASVAKLKAWCADPAQDTENRC